MHSTEKSALRRELRRTRASLSRQERQTAEKAAARRLKLLAKRGRHIGVYWPAGSEMRLDGFVQTALKRGAHLYLPYIEPRSLRLWFTPFPQGNTAAERRRGQSKLHIPQFAGRKIRAHRLHILILPLVGIDMQGFRLGQGGGYYDVTLAALEGRLKPKLVGAGFACQLLQALPRETHDRPLDAFACERGVLVFRRHTPQQAGKTPPFTKIHRP